MNQTTFTKDFHYLVALIQHLGTHEKYNSRTPRNIADSTGLDFHGVSTVLVNYPAFFRKSPNSSTQGEPLFALHTRYARRKKVEGVGYTSEAITPEEMQTLLGLVTNMIGVEAENHRLKTESTFNQLKIWVGILAAFGTAIAAILSK